MAITVTNNTSTDIYVSVTTSGIDVGTGGSDGWFTLKANGGTDTWNHRDSWQVIRFTRSKTPGVLVETILGVPGTTTNIY